MTTPPLLPTGRQTLLQAHDQTAVVVQVGGGLRDYRVGGRPVLDGYAQDEACSGSRGLPLVPWPNRLHEGRYTWRGQEHVLPVDHPATRSAIHGLARWQSWEPVAQEADRVTLQTTLWPRPAWPFTLTVSVEHVLGPDGLVVTTVAEATGAQDVPYACGAHPYLTVGTATVDEVELHLPARTRLTTDEDGIPTGREEVAGTAYDFRTAGAVGDRRLDTAYTDLARGADGRARATLRNPADGRELDLWVDGGYDLLMVFTGDTVSPPQRRRRGLAVEPMSAPPNALQTGEGLVTVRAGDVHTTRWGITPRGW